MIRQIFIVSSLNFQNIGSRFWQSMITVVGLAVTICVLLSMMSLSEGILQGYTRAGDPSRAIVVSSGAETEPASTITRDVAAIISTAPGIARDSDGSSLIDPAVNASLPVTRNDGSSGNTTMRGVGPKALKVRPEIVIVAGRMFRAGKREMVVGIAAQAQYQDMRIGDKVVMPDGEWSIVGSFKSGDVLEGQVLGDVLTVMASTHRTNYNSVLVRLSAPGAFAAFKNSVTSNPALSVTVERHSDWYKRFSAGSTGFLTGIAYTVGIIMAIGALFGCLNTMYAAVSARESEIAMLRALGFGALPVAVSVLLEAVLLSLAGALIGAAFAWVLLDGRESVFGNNVYQLAIPLRGIGLGVIWACIVALLGGSLPSVYAARRSVAEALRAT